MQAAVKHLPLFAYIEGRQAGDALDRVMSHCVNVRSVTKGSYNPFARRKGEPIPTCAGGMQLSLDLTKAYDDRVSWDRLISASPENYPGQ